jgi:hypothetical protein
MSRNIIFVLIYHRHKLLDLIYLYLLFIRSEHLTQAIDITNTTGMSVSSRQCMTIFDKIVTKPIVIYQPTSVFN